MLWAGQLGPPKPLAVLYTRKGMAYFVVSTGFYLARVQCFLALPIPTFWALEPLNSVETIKTTATFNVGLNIFYNMRWPRAYGHRQNIMV